jgi:hypothetical protein
MSAFLHLHPFEPSVSSTFMYTHVAAASVWGAVNVQPFPLAVHCVQAAVAVHCASVAAKLLTLSSAPASAASDS